MASYVVWLTLGSCHLPTGIRSRCRTRYGTIRFCLSRRHHRDLKSQGGVLKTQGRKSENKYRKMRVFQYGDPLPRTHCDKNWSRKNCYDRTTPYTTRHQRCSPVFEHNLVVPTFCPEFCQNLPIVNPTIQES